MVEVERIGVLHQELARAHHAEARPHLVAELPLDVVEIERQVLVGADGRAKDFGDHLLVRRPIEHVALVPVADAQHLLAVVVVAAGFAPEIRRLDGRHQDLDRARAVLLLADDGANLVQDPDAERQPGVAARRLLPDHAGAQHEPMRDDLRLLGRLLQDRQEIAGKTHREAQMDQSAAEETPAAGLMASVTRKGQAMLVEGGFPGALSAKRGGSRRSALNARAAAKSRRRPVARRAPGPEAASQQSSPPALPFEQRSRLLVERHERLRPAARRLQGDDAVRKIAAGLEHLKPTTVAGPLAAGVARLHQ